MSSSSYSFLPIPFWNQYCLLNESKLFKYVLDQSSAFPDGEKTLTSLPFESFEKYLIPNQFNVGFFVATLLYDSFSSLIEKYDSKAYFEYSLGTNSVNENVYFNLDLVTENVPLGEKCIDKLAGGLFFKW
ncbi:Uncharacterised protein, partial [Mycoplasmopsis edwardii]